MYWNPTLTYSGEKSPSLNILIASGVNLKAFKEINPFEVFAVSRKKNVKK